MATTQLTTAYDSRGIAIRIGDRVRVGSYGWAIRQTDVGRTAEVVDITARGLVKLNSNVFLGEADIANGKAVRGACLHVLDRTGGDGTEANRLGKLAREYGIAFVPVPDAEALEAAAAHEERLKTAVVRACEACNAEAGETCRPGCIGEAAELDELPAFAQLQLDHQAADEAELDRIREGEQQGSEKAAQAAVVVRSQLLSNPLLAPHLADALEALCSFAEGQLDL